MFLVKSLPLAGSVLEQLGFYVTARSEQKGLGTANRLIVLDSQYIEVLTVERASAANAFLGQALLKGDGLVGVVLAIDNADTAYAELRKGAVNAQPPFEFSRDVVVSEGVREASFRVIFLDAPSSPGLRLAACQHRTRDLIWRKEWQTHPNTACALGSIVVVVEQLDLVQSAYEPIFGRPAVLRTAGEVSFRLGATELRFLLPLQAELEFGERSTREPADREFILSLNVNVRSLTAASNVLKANAVPFFDCGARSLRVPAAAACGTILEFTERPTE
jgi:hypothetical protein